MLSADEVKPWSRESRLLWQQHTSLYLKDGVLWRRVLGGGEGKLQLVVPAKLRQDILRSLQCAVPGRPMPPKEEQVCKRYR